VTKSPRQNPSGSPKDAADKLDYSTGMDANPDVLISAPPFFLGAGRSDLNYGVSRHIAGRSGGPHHIPLLSLYQLE